jgi:hypothetical protein
MVGDRHQNGSHPAKSCQASFGPSSVLFCPTSGSKGLSSAIISIRDHRIECRTMLHKTRLSWTQWTTTQLQQGSEHTRVKPRTSRPDSRALDRSKTNRLLPAQLTASCYNLCAARSNFTSGRRRARANIAILYKYNAVQYSLT